MPSIRCSAVCMTWEWLRPWSMMRFRSSTCWAPAGNAASMTNKATDSMRMVGTPVAVRRNKPTARARQADCAPRCSRTPVAAVERLLRGDDLAEPLEARAIELGELHLRDRVEVVRAGGDLDALHGDGYQELADARRLLHDVLTRQVIAALREHLDQGRAHAEGVDRVAVVRVHLREILLHEVAV